ncbi:stage II sporulation protein M [Bacillus sp. A17A.1]
MSLNRSQKIVIFTIIFSILSIGFLTGYKLITLFDLNATDYNGADYYKNNEGFSGVISIFMNNIKIDILVISGIFLLCLPTILLLFMNGFWIGLPLKQAYLQDYQ